jgi:hypothetical protein
MQNIQELKQIKTKARADRDSAQILLDNHLNSALRPMIWARLKEAELALDVAETRISLLTALLASHRGKK